MEGDRNMLLIAVHLCRLLRAWRTAGRFTTLAAVHQGTGAALGGLAGIEMSNDGYRHLILVALVFRDLDDSATDTLHLLHLMTYMHTCAMALCSFDLSLSHTHTLWCLSVCVKQPRKSLMGWTNLSSLQTCGPSRLFIYIMSEPLEHQPSPYPRPVYFYRWKTKHVKKSNISTQNRRKHF